MPKIRCKSCEATLNVPEKALGKTIACPKCKSKIKIPSRKGGGQAGQSRPKKKKPARKPAADDPFGLGNLDDIDMEHADSQICPYCAEDMDEEEVICRGCGMNIETGQMDRKEAKRRSRKGADPAKFYGTVWKESWKFMLKETRMAVRVGTAFTLFSTIALMCGYMGFVYVQEQMPPKTFWIIMTMLSGLSVPGLFWYLSLKIIESTRLKTKFQSERIKFDLFTSIATGVRAFAWPIVFIPGAVVLIPLILVILALSIAIGGSQILIGLLVALLATPLFFLPMSLVHMTARYTYKGWILWEMLKVLLQNITALIYTHLIAFVSLLPVLVVAVPILLVIKGDGGVGALNPFGSGVINGLTTTIASGLLDLMGMNPAPEGALFTILRALFNIAAAFIVIAPIGYLAAFPAIFFMKANGLFGYYNAQTLDLVDRMPQNQPATFWVRYLSHIIDSMCAPLAVFLVSSNAKLSKIAWVFFGITLLAGGVLPESVSSLVGLLAGVYFNWMYWSVQESSELRSTLGKDAFGLIVVTEDGKTLTMKQASTKWLLRNISDTLGGLPYLLAAIPPKKLAMHDSATKTKVVWVGDK